MQAVNTEFEYAKKSALQRFKSRLAASDRSLPLITGSIGFALGSVIVAALRPKHHHKIAKARAASSLGALAAGAIAAGVSATGAVAIGALAIGKLKIKQLDVERFRVGSFVER